MTRRNPNITRREQLKRDAHATRELALALLGLVVGLIMLLRGSDRAGRE